MPSLLQDPIFSNIYHGSHQSSNIFKGGPCSTSSLLQDGMHLALIPLVITERKKFHYKESNNRAHTRLGRNYTDYYSEELQELVSYKILQKKKKPQHQTSETFPKDLYIQVPRYETSTHSDTTICNIPNNTPHKIE